MTRLAIFMLCASIFLQCAPKTQSTELETKQLKSSSGLCAPTLIGEYVTDKPAPVFTGLEYFNFPITTDSKQAQKYFNQGWALAAGFNHAEAARSLYWATQIDPDCAMCYWGLAYVLGPNYNAGMSPEVVSDAINSIQTARLLSANCSEKERDLIDAMSKRYPAEISEDRTAFDIEYSVEFSKLHAKYPNDNDISVLYAESIMNLHPWDLWDENGAPKEWTNEILNVLNGVKENDPTNAIANHLYIHSVEASDEPVKGKESAQLLSDIAPGAGHLVHMPSHIYIRTGNYKDCVKSNIDAVNVDSVYVSACHASGAYPLAYYPHNFHFLCACAALEGDGELSYEAAMRMQVKLDTNVMKEDGWGTVQHYYTIPYYIMVKFEMWDRVLNTEMPDVDLPYPQAILTYARGMAFAGQGKMQAANKELISLNSLAKNEAIKSINVWEINEAIDLVHIAEYVLQAEILHASNNAEAAIPILIKAIEIEDHLNYNEPPDWFFSVRHYLGNVYLSNGDWTSAEEVYRKDLFNFPENGWALSGLYESLIKQGRDSEAQAVLGRFENAWSGADVKLKGSVIL